MEPTMSLSNYFGMSRNGMTIQLRADPVCCCCWRGSVWHSVTRVGSCVVRLPALHGQLQKKLVFPAWRLMDRWNRPWHTVDGTGPGVLYVVLTPAQDRTTTSRQFLPWKSVFASTETGPPGGCGY